MNLPNKITLARIVLIPIFIVILNLPIKYREFLAAAVFIVLSLSDALDGYLARKRKEVTNLGKFIDPLADKLLVTAALIFLIGHGVEPWMAFLIIAREFAVTGLRILAASKNVVISAKKMGKLKTISQIIAVIAVLLDSEFAWHIMLVAVVFTVVSGVDYFVAAKKLLNEKE
ncbi:CDP-diacylglycerol--glycerol-3-phosphate 3-phosphatidyltransferase [Candidatus Woesearchaeota archaeon]|nr:CDP-diacylglycerol--glycerol-3-phosphate 3-phosphatidyltransferase [Candidatus Woesearchaeota archaeon]